MDYGQAQCVQLGLCAIYCLVVRAFLQRSGSTWRQSPFLSLCLGYSVACAASNFMRYSMQDRTALGVIGEQEYIEGTVVWWVCLTLTTAGYCALHRRRGATSCSQPMTTAGSRGRLETFYGLISAVGLIGFLTNPYRNVNYGNLNPSSPEAIVIGGLMVGGIFTMILATGAVGLFIVRPTLGYIPLLLTIFLFTYSGSKGMSAVLVLYIVYLTWKMKTRRPVWKVLRLLLPLMIYAVGLVLTLAVSFRGGGSDVRLSNAASTSLTRFTQQDVVAVLWANPDWMRESRNSYVFAQFASFVPGSLWHDKPRNPAYQVNALYAPGGSVTAASVSVFGSLLIACGRWAFLPPLIVLGFLLAKLDRYVCSFPNYLELEWTYVFSLVMILETVYVLAFLGMLLTLFCLRVNLTVHLHPRFVSTPGRNRPRLPRASATWTQKKWHSAV
jgi:hypothetical protein